LAPLRVPVKPGFGFELEGSFLLGSLAELSCLVQPPRDMITAEITLRVLSAIRSVRLTWVVEMPRLVQVPMISIHAAPPLVRAEF